MSRYQAWSDGSCVKMNETGLGSGGWAAVVEHKSDGWVLRGREHQVTSSRMEMLASLEALRSIPRGQGVDLRIDYTGMLSIREEWNRARTRGSWRPKMRRRDSDLWRSLFLQFDQLDVRVILIEKGANDRVHSRCHHIANAEARALHRGDDPPELKVRDRSQPRTTYGVHNPAAASGWHAFDQA